MSLSEQEFELALLQVQELANLSAKKSTAVRIARQIHIKRLAFKQQAKLMFRRIFHVPAAKPAKKLKILVHIRGGIGDVCMARLFVVRLREKFPTALIYFCYDHKDVVDMVFSDGYIDGFVKRGYEPLEYDLVISGCHALRFDHADEARLKALAPKWMPAFKRAKALQEKIKTILDNTPLLDGIWAKISVEYGSTRVQNMGLTSGIPVWQNDRAPIALEAEKQAKILKKFDLENTDYITIHDGTNNNTDLHGRAATRCWSRAHWEQFGHLFKEKFPQLKIVQLGGNNSVPFDFADICLVGKTTVADLPYILEGSRLHIDGESGMVHLANLTSTRSIVMFGPSPLEYLAYKQNINLQAGPCKDCMCIYADWMSRCPLFETNRCMQSIFPQRVMAEVEKILKPTLTKARKIAKKK